MAGFYDCAEYRQDLDLEFVLRVAQFGPLWSATVDGYKLKGLGYSALASIESFVELVKRMRNLDGEIDRAEFTEDDAELSSLMMMDLTDIDGGA